MPDGSANDLIRALATTDAVPSNEQIEAIINQLVAAPFDQRVVPVSMRLRGQRYQGRVLGPRQDSLTYHLAKRMLDEQQWAVGTTAGQYVADLHQAAGHPSAQLAVYERRGGVIAMTLTSTQLVVPPQRRGAKSVALLLVVYAVDRSMIVSGYQVSALDQTGVPGEARWLR